MLLLSLVVVCICFFFQAEDGIRYLVRSRGLGDVYKRQRLVNPSAAACDWRAPATDCMVAWLISFMAWAI